MNRGIGRRTRKQQIATLSIIAVAVITLSIGFAAFSSTLRISSQAQVNPDASAFSVIFSNDGSNTDTEQTVNPSSSTYGEAATITNSASPTISGLNAKFTSPGQSVSYSFFAKNTGSYLAYLNYITFNNVEGEDNNIVCTAQDGTTQDLVDDACEGINLSIKVGNDEAVTTSQSGIQNHTLAATHSEPVIVTITYDENAAVADGDFTVAFGDISLTYSTVVEGGGPSAGGGGTETGGGAISPICDPVTVATVGNVPTKGVYNVGDEYTCNVDGTPRTFFILNTTGNNVSMIMNEDIASEIDWGQDTSVNATDEGCEMANACGSTNSGPFVAMNKMHQLTQNWNVPSININYDDPIYGGIYTTGTTTIITNGAGDTKATYENLKARLPLYDEVKDLGAAPWLVVGTTEPSYTSSNLGGVVFTLTASSLSSVYAIGTDGVGSHEYIRADMGSSQAIRPVIELTTDYLNN